MSQVSRLWSAFAKDPSLWKHVRLICQKGVSIHSQLDTLCKQTPVGSGSLTWLTLKGTDVEADIFQRGFEPPVTDCLTNLLRLDFDNHLFPEFSWLTAFAPHSPLLKHVTFAYCAFAKGTCICFLTIQHRPAMRRTLKSLKYFRLTCGCSGCVCGDKDKETRSTSYLVHDSRDKEYKLRETRRGRRRL